MLQTYNPKNHEILISINGKLLPRADAKVSVFDSAVQGGDAVWEGLRVYNGKIFALSEHLDRLIHSARAMAYTEIPDRNSIREQIFELLNANKMSDGVHIRLTLTRGEKITSGMDPRLNQSGTTLIILAEWKPPVYDSKGIKLITSSIRRNSPQFLDSKIHHNNLINNILAKIEANVGKADDALMLDHNGFVSETNATNIFMIKNGIIYTPTADSCLPGITRKTVIETCKAENIEILQKNCSLTEFYTADQVFVSGTMGELVSVYEIDGREIIHEGDRDIIHFLSQKYLERVKSEGVSIPGIGR